jgi:hypothetical protein
VVDEVVAECRRHGLAICQMPCPEQRAWGGMLKRERYGAHRLEGVAPRLWAHAATQHLSERRSLRSILYDAGSLDSVAARVSTGAVVEFQPSGSSGPPDPQPSTRDRRTG